MQSDRPRVPRTTTIQAVIGTVTEDSLQYFIRIIRRPEQERQQYIIRSIHVIMILLLLLIITLLIILMFRPAIVIKGKCEILLSHLHLQGYFTIRLLIEK